jgi:hypothetical protein
VIRAGFGMFYDRFGLANVLTAQRYNGIIQQQYVIANPDFFPAAPPVSALPGPVPFSTIQKVSSTLRSPYLIQSAVAFERQLPRNTTVAITCKRLRITGATGLDQITEPGIKLERAPSYAAGAPRCG